MSLLDELITKLDAMPPKAMAELTDTALSATKHMPWVPNAGPQTQAYLSPADVLLFGGAAGGSKTDLLLGLAFTAHRRALILRRHYTDLGALTERAIAINGTNDGFNGSSPPKLRTRDGRLIEFGAAQHPGSEQQWQGHPHDLLAFDESVQFLEAQVRFLMTWVRTTEPNQRTRTVLASNPPVDPTGDWIVGMFRPWLDLTHDKPAKPGELRWFAVTPDGKEIEVEGSEPVQFPGQSNPVIPKSRTFIPAKLADNPFLLKTDYAKELDALPEPYRSAYRDGNFMAARTDQPNQAIPFSWLSDARSRWTPKPPDGVPMVALGVDVAQGGADNTVIACRHDGWFAPLVVIPGVKTPLGTDVAGAIVSARRDGATVVIDLGGGYGSAPMEHLRANDPDFPIVGYKGAEKSTRRTHDNKLKFTNKRSEAYWRFREALDPGRPGGSPIALPDDPTLLADLAAPTFEIGPNGIKIEPKEKLVERLGRSPDRGDAAVMAWFAGTRDVMDRVALLGLEQRPHNYRQMPKVVMGRDAQRRGAGR